MVQIVDLQASRSQARSKGPVWNSLPPSVEIIGLDPGGTTGWAYMNVAPEALIDPNERILDNIILHSHGQVDCTGFLETTGTSDIIRLLSQYPGAFVVIEDFIPRQLNQSREFLSPVRIGAVLRWWLSIKGRNFTFQMPSEAKTTATDDRLHAWKGKSVPRGLYQDDKMVHARDADRHVITFLRKAIGKSDKQQDQREFAWPHLYTPGRPWGPTLEEEEPYAGAMPEDQG